MFYQSLFPKSRCTYTSCFFSPYFYHMARPLICQVKIPPIGNSNLNKLGAITESCRVASTNPVNIYQLLGILRRCRGGSPCPPF